MQDEQRLKSILATQVSLLTDKLSDLELAVLNTVVQLDMNPHNRIFDYEKVKMLFTEDNGTKTHDEIKVALAKVVNRRIK